MRFERGSLFICIEYELLCVASSYKYQFDFLRRFRLKEFRGFAMGRRKCRITLCRGS